MRRAIVLLLVPTARAALSSENPLCQLCTRPGFEVLNERPKGMFFALSTQHGIRAGEDAGAVPRASSYYDKFLLGIRRQCAQRFLAPARQNDVAEKLEKPLPGSRLRIAALAVQPLTEPRP